MSKSSGYDFVKLIDQLFDLEEVRVPTPPLEEKKEAPKTRDKKSGGSSS